MEFHIQQRKVRNGFLAAFSLAFPTITLSALLNPLSLESHYSLQTKLEFASMALLLPALFLLFSVARLACHRVTSPEDIHGRAKETNSNQANYLQSLIQNTLEQFVLAAFTYYCWVIVMPSTTFTSVIFASILFAIGRLVFFLGYRTHPGLRAFGFTLTFLPSILMILGVVIFTLHALATSIAI